MMIEEVREYWCRRLERAENYSDEHWDTDYGQQLFKFCPNCGADMREGGANNDSK